MVKKVEPFVAIPGTIHIEGIWCKFGYETASGKQAMGWVRSRGSKIPWKNIAALLAERKEASHRSIATARLRRVHPTDEAYKVIRVSGTQFTGEYVCWYKDFSGVEKYRYATKAVDEMAAYVEASKQLEALKRQALESRAKRDQRAKERGL